MWWAPTSFNTTTTNDSIINDTLIEAYPWIIKRIQGIIQKERDFLFNWWSNKTKEWDIHYHPHYYYIKQSVLRLQWFLQSFKKILDRNTEWAPFPYEDFLELHTLYKDYYTDITQLHTVAYWERSAYYQWFLPSYKKKVTDTFDLLLIKRWELDKDFVQTYYQNALNGSFQIVHDYRLASIDKKQRESDNEHTLFYKHIAPYYSQLLIFLEAIKFYGIS